MTIIVAVLALLAGLAVGRYTADQALMDAVARIRDRYDDAQERLNRAAAVPVWLVRSHPGPRGWTPTRKNTEGRI